MGKDEEKEKAAYFQHKWKKDFRVGSPQRVFRSVQDSIEDLGYKTPNDAISGTDEETGGIKLKQSPISDTATFRGHVRGERTLSTQRHKGYFWAAIAMLVLFVLGVVGATEAMMATGIIDAVWLFVSAIVTMVMGYVFIRASMRDTKAFLLATVEGEAYKATAKMVEYAQELDVVADVRLTVQGRIGIFNRNKEVSKQPSKADAAKLEDDFMKLCDQVSAVLPKFMVRQPE